MKASISLFSVTLAGVLFLAACSKVDTTGLSPDSNRPPHPRSNVNSTVLVEEFIDLQCEACRAAQTRVVKPMLERYGSQIRYEVKYYPIFPHHQYAFIAAEAAECAADQGKFWEFEEMNYENQPSLNSRTIQQWAQSLGLDMTLFERCTKSGIKRATVEADQAEGNQRGVQGTPTFFVNGEMVESTVEAIGAAVQKAASGAAMRL